MKLTKEQIKAGAALGMNEEQTAAAIERAEKLANLEPRRKTVIEKYWEFMDLAVDLSDDDPEFNFRQPQSVGDRLMDWVVESEKTEGFTTNEILEKFPTMKGGIKITLSHLIKDERLTGPDKNGKYSVPVVSDKK